MRRNTEKKRDGGGMEAGKASGPITCFGCGSLIIDRYVLRSMERFWHEDCLKCTSCGCRLAELGSTLFSRNNLTLCRRDYLKLFGPNGHCSVCRKVIPAFELVMRARSRIFHLECFACQECGHRFCVGDRYYFADEKILCEYDFEEKMLFRQLSYGLLDPSSMNSCSSFNQNSNFLQLSNCRFLNPQNDDCLFSSVCQANFSSLNQPFNLLTHFSSDFSQNC